MRPEKTQARLYGGPFLSDLYTDKPMSSVEDGGRDRPETLDQARSLLLDWHLGVTGQTLDELIDDLDSILSDRRLASTGRRE